MNHPYSEFEGSQLWATLDAEIAALEANGDIALSTSRPYVIGSLAKALSTTGPDPALHTTTRPSNERSWQCAFCGDVIRDTLPVTLLLDVDGGGHQELRAHRSCFVQAVHPSVPVA